MIESVGRVRNTAKTRVVAETFNKLLDKLKTQTGEKPKLESMPVSQTSALESLARAYRRGRIPKRAQESAIAQGVNSARFEYLQSHDELTDYYLTRGVRDELLKRVAQIRRKRVTGLGIIVVDIKKFKLFNDVLGHPVGDEIIKKITQLIKEKSREEDALWRIAGDEFAIIMEVNKESDLERKIGQKRLQDGVDQGVWLEIVNQAIRKKLTSIKKKEKALKTVDWQDAGELRAGVLFVDNKYLAKIGDKDDIPGRIILDVKTVLKRIKKQR